MEQANNKVKFVQYLNTVILTVIGIVSTVIVLQLNKVVDSQADFAKEMVHLNTVQEINTGRLDQIDTRVKTLELNYLDYIKTWVDQNYVRKPQSK